MNVNFQKKFFYVLPYETGFNETMLTLLSDFQDYDFDPLDFLDYGLLHGYFPIEVCPYIFSSKYYIYGLRKELQIFKGK